jgi:hypothetical protein
MNRPSPSGGEFCRLTAISPWIALPGLRQVKDPFERADFKSNTYFDWTVDHVPQLYLMQATVAAEIDNFVKFPPRQKPASFNLDAVRAMVSTHGAPA